MFNAEAVDDLNPQSYAQSTLDPDVLLPELGFKHGGSADSDRVALPLELPSDPHYDYWIKRVSRGIYLSAIVNKRTGLVSFRKVRLTDPLDVTGEFTVLDHHFDVPPSEVRRIVNNWPRTEVEETIHQLLDADIDAFDPLRRPRPPDPAPLPGLRGHQHQQRAG